MSSRVRTSCVVLVGAGCLLTACGTAKSGAPSPPASGSTLSITTTTTTVPVSKPTVPPTTSNTSKPSPGQWPQRTIASFGSEYVQDTAPTSTEVYWLSQLGVISNNGSPVTVYKYNPNSGQVTKGPSTTGFIGSPALTDTGGWVWMVVGVGDDVVVRQLDPSTLALHASESLPVKDGLSPNGAPELIALLSATVDGPLWVAGDDDLWALNPNTGTVETEFDTDIESSSMSTTRPAACSTSEDRQRRPVG